MDNPKLQCSVQCEYCGNTFARLFCLYRHLRRVHQIKIYKRDIGDVLPFAFKCNGCSLTFKYSKSLSRHKRLVHGERKDSAWVATRRQKSELTTTADTSKTEVNSNSCTEQIRKIESTLPDHNGEYYLTHYDKKGKIGVDVEFIVKNLLQAHQWRAKYLEKNKIFLRKTATRKSNKESVVYKEHFHCGRFIKLQRNSNRGDRHTNCRFGLQMLVKKEDFRFFTRVRILNEHNHPTHEAASLKFRPVLKDIRDKFIDLFDHGFTPKTAMKSHIEDLKEKYKEDAFRILEDRAYNPDHYWVYRLHSSFKAKYGDGYRPKVLEKLKENVRNFEYAELKIIDEDSNYVVSIVSKFMMQVHHHVSECSEIIFMDSTETLDMPGWKVFILLTNSWSGSLPVGIVITTIESEDAIAQGLKMINDLVMERSWGGRGIRGPLLFITDDSPAERGALHQVFPEARLLLSQFHMLRAAWRFVWKNESDINAKDKHTLFHLFKILVYETDTDVFMKTAQEIFQNKDVERYPLFVKYLKETLNRKEDWATCFRLHFLIARGQNTSNICDTNDANMRIVKEVILRTIKAFSPVHLFTILTIKFEEYYLDKLTSNANGQSSQFLLQKLRKLTKSDKLIYDNCTKKVHCNENDSSYVVDIDLGLCSCPDGTVGKFCKHLFAAFLKSKLHEPVMKPKTEADIRILLEIVKNGKLSKENPILKSCVLFNNERKWPRRNTKNPITVYGLEELKNGLDSNTIDLNIATREITNIDIADVTEVHDGQTITDKEFYRFKVTCDEISNMIKKYPVLRESAKIFVDTFKQITTIAELAKALTNFGKYTESVDSHSFKL